MAHNRLETLRHDQTRLDGLLKGFERLVRRRMRKGEFTKLAVVIADGVPTDVIETDRRKHTEDFDPDTW